MGLILYAVILCIPGGAGLGRSPGLWPEPIATELPTPMLRFYCGANLMKLNRSRGKKRREPLQIKKFACVYIIRQTGRKIPMALLAGKQ